MSPAGNVNDAEPNGVVALRGTTTMGLIGSSLVMMRVHACGPADVGVKLTPRSRLESALIVAGNSAGFTSAKCGRPPGFVAVKGQEMTAEATLRPQEPVLSTFSVCVAPVPPLQTEAPKLPLPVSVTVPDPVLQVAVTTVVGLTGSLLAMLKVAVFDPTDVGVQLNAKLKLASGLMFTGKVGPAASEISVLPEVWVMLVMERLSAPVSDTSN